MIYEKTRTEVMKCLFGMRLRRIWRVLSEGEKSIDFTNKSKMRVLQNNIKEMDVDYILWGEVIDIENIYSDVSAEQELMVIKK